jgi:hypothetical protein
MKNKLKYESYKAANNLLNDAIVNNDLPRCIASIAVCESIIADRLQSYLKYKAPGFFLEKGKERKFIPTSVMATEGLKHFPKHSIHVNSKTHGVLESKNLFTAIKIWLKSRNDICHGFVKSKPGTPTKEISEFHKAAIKTAEEGFKLTKLLSKWHKQQLQITKKKKEYASRN